MTICERKGKEGYLLNCIYCSQGNNTRGGVRKLIQISLKLDVIIGFKDSIISLPGQQASRAPCCSPHSRADTAGAGLPGPTVAPTSLPSASLSSAGARGRIHGYIRAEVKTNTDQNKGSPVHSGHCYCSRWSYQANTDPSQAWSWCQGGNYRLQNLVPTRSG